MSEYQNAAITADTLVYSASTQSIVLVRRKNEPFKDHWALPGGFFNAYDRGELKADESIHEAAERELQEEVGLVFPHEEDAAPLWIAKGMIGVWDDIGRDPRGRVVTHAFYVTVYKELPLKPSDDAADAQWFKVEDILLDKVRMAFDHQDIVAKFMKRP